MNQKTKLCEGDVIPLSLDSIVNALRDHIRSGIISELQTKLKGSGISFDCHSVTVKNMMDELVAEFRAMGLSIETRTPDVYYFRLP